MTQANASMRAARIPVGAVALHVGFWGDAGPDVLLLHGIGSRGASWLPIVDELSREFRVIAPDLRGHGDSDKPANGYRVADYADDLDGLIDALGIERPLVIGHSLGGLIAWDWASRRPRLAAGIVIEDAPLRANAADDARFDAWTALARLAPVEAAAHFRIKHPNWTDEECERRARSITATQTAVFTESRDANRATNNRLEQIGAIESPMLLVHGDPAAGGMVNDHDAGAFVRAAPNGRAAKVSEGSHALHRDSTEVFLAVVLPFLRANSR